MSTPPLAKFILARPWLLKIVRPIANWHANAAGYRQLGLKIDDLTMEENEIVQLALKRLPPKEAYDRVFRLRRAMQLSVSHQLLPKEQWTKPEEDELYLDKYIKEIEEEMKEREDLEAMVITKRKANAKEGQ
ncbi:ubiquinol-cytochrome C reductase complex 14kD subunit-domain-containing protein [Lophiotrema nucula]|uniref:Complex III subunit 7 n=1 Tax=Lophiotrema nucula TaxID=690887 RepID=A0A6A5ZE28_9PLEO|nr:ubiquinol-cytochrome C reductase complex 14kD subunit-domain-containing protein [Lophiotrema nucula]